MKRLLFFHDNFWGFLFFWIIDFQFNDDVDDVTARSFGRHFKKKIFVSVIPFDIFQTCYSFHRMEIVFD